MADAFHWPDESEIEALDLEHGTITSATPQGQTLPSGGQTPAGGQTLPPRGQTPPAEPEWDAEDVLPDLPAVPAVPPPARTHTVQIETLDEDDAWFPTEADGDMSSPAFDERKAASRSAWEELRAKVGAASAIGAGGSSPIYRYGLPILAVVVVLETAWLAAGMFSARDKTPPPAKPAASTPAAGTQQPASSATSTPPATAPADPSRPAAPVMNAAQTKPAAAAPPAAPPGADAAVPPAVPPGSVSIALPFQVQVYEGDRLIGINDGSELPLTPGSHRLQLVNDSLGFRLTQAVTVSSGRTTKVTVQVPSVSLQVNAVPWADVTIDGTAVGETPLGNVPVSIGPHTIVFRHPQLGTQTRTVVVTQNGDTKVAVDLRR